MMPIKILICDDDEGILDMLALVLEENFNIITENNSANIYALIEQEKPEFLILDLWMPVLSGDVILKNLKKNPKTANLPILVVSASADGRKIAMEAGADDYLEKPFDVDVLTNIIYKLLNQK
ncbi:DNA-binding response OmpR family regulator [Pedobacter sp. UYP30]|uniref:response regulator n=1 Tax=Pedobacter sp. UYP30 TaxID=1756400 RepID=UPI003399C97B